METMNVKEKRIVLPLTGSSFKSGKMAEYISEIKDQEVAEIAQAEAYYFTAQAEKCVKIAKRYLQSEDLMLRLTADMLCTFANLTLGNITDSQLAREDTYECLKKTQKRGGTEEEKASCVFAYYLTSIFLHITPEDDTLSLEQSIQYLPQGQQLFAISVLAHLTYLQGEYEKALGLVQSAMILSKDVYPIPYVYLYCMLAISQINLKNQQAAQQSVKEGWELARKDKLLEPFVEHHGLLQGVLEVCVRKTEPEVYKKLVNGVISFSRGWMKIHNPKTQKQVTDLLTPLEFSIAMLACRDWTNQEIAEHMGMSVNTVKHYVSDILEKLHINKRDKIKEFVNQ